MDDINFRPASEVVSVHLWPSLWVKFVDYLVTPAAGVVQT